MGRGMRLLALVAAALAPTAGGAARGDLASEARSAADVWERKPTLRDALVYVASDLEVRSRREPGTAVLVLVVDPTTSFREEIRALLMALESARAAGPRGMRMGVVGAGAESVAPTGIPSEVASLLQQLALVPADGPKNLHEVLRTAARGLADAGKGPKALVLLTEEQGDAEDDVEATREALLGSGAAFYAVGPEAAFERPWEYDFEPDDVPAAGLTERFVPDVRRHAKGNLYRGAEIAYGLVPYQWEFDLAQTTFVWLRPPAWPVPAGFGYWNLATLCFSTGGRYFVFDFAAAAAEAANPALAARRRTLYDFARLRLLAPDLRPRAKVLKDLDRDPRAVAILKIWQLLADEETPVLRDLPTLEVRGSSLTPRAARPVRSTWTPRPWIEKEDHVEEAREAAAARLARVEQALGTWASAHAKESRVGEDAPEALRERIEADFQLLGVQLLKVRFAWEEYLAALRSIRPLDLSYRRVRILPVPLVEGTKRPARPERLEGEEREARFAELMAAQRRMAEKYAGTPWSLLLEKGRVYTFRKDVQVLEAEEPRPDRPPRPPEGQGGKPSPPKPAPPPQPAQPPPPGPRPGSGGAGPTTGG